jgi:mRNA-degrading endonuclease RelE of RelBE toxin-antitoxin system
MQYNFKSSFDRCFNKLSPQKQKLIQEAIEKLKIFYATRQMSDGLGLKNMRKNYWEIRASIRDRILFFVQDDIVSFILVGNHDDMRRYLKKI